MSVLDRFRLDGKTALVTGASRGLGFEMALALGEAGARVIIAARDPDRLRTASETLAAKKIQFETAVADLEKPQKAVEFCQDVLERDDPIDILVNNVGGRRINFATEEMPLDEWQRIVDLNLTQAFVCTKIIGGAMLPRNQGRVINVSSISGTVATKAMRGRAYETSKAALTMFTRAVAADWASQGVTVNAIAPGPFLTDANRRWIEQKPELKKQIEETIPAGRMGRPEEIGPLAVYLASDASSFVTGATFVIDGGRTLW